VQDEIRRRHPDVPLVLLGHSMGSFIAQDFLMRNPQNAVALILSGSSFPARRQLIPGHWIARLLAWRQGPRARSTLLNQMGFASFNKRFAPNRTEFDWLSRDESEVDRYVADPLCGAAQAIGSGRISPVQCSRFISDAGYAGPLQLPLLITGGEGPGRGVGHEPPC
jgi:alpha-beta hydrolase superfamily lysophospholipase